MKSLQRFSLRIFMDDQKIIIESVAMDLKRVALGLHRGSFQMANRFKEEALNRLSELNNMELNAHLKNIVQRSRESLNKNTDRSAEDALMYSTLFQNYCIKKFK